MKQALIFEYRLFLFRIRKLSEHVKIYRKWWVFVGKYSRDRFYKKEANHEA